jgi:hypothetical protein
MKQLDKKERVINVLAIVLMILLILISYMFVRSQYDKVLMDYYKDQMLNFCELAKLRGTYTLNEPCSHWITR